MEPVGAKTQRKQASKSHKSSKRPSIALLPIINRCVNKVLPVLEFFCFFGCILGRAANRSITIRQLEQHPAEKVCVLAGIAIRLRVDEEKG